MQYGKIENGVLVYASNSLIINDTRVINPTVEMLLEQGYKPVIRTEYPQDRKHYKQGYEETAAEIKVVWIDNEAAEREYWVTIDYNTAVEAEIAKRYTIGQELAAQRQKEKKPEEYAEYYAYCEKCKAHVKEQKKKHDVIL